MCRVDKVAPIGELHDHMPANLILASASPRRRELLRQLDVSFDIVPSGIPEVPLEDEEPACFAGRAAREKALDVAAKIPATWVIGADTVVVLDDRIIGKPVDEPDARAMLRHLSGRQHQVLTAIAFIGPDGRLENELVVTSTVQFRTLSDPEIAAYVSTGEPMDKAGGYAIQGGAGDFVRNVKGSYTNVIGFPMDEVRDLLERAGLLSSNEQAPGAAPQSGK